MSYGLDPAGNRSTESSSLPDIPSGSFSFNADDEISSEVYDPNGNVTASGGKSFGYDSQNQMLSMTASGTAVSMTYDAFGNRVGKSVNGVVTRYLVDDLNPTGYPQVMEELNGAGTVTRTYTYGLQRIDEEQVLNGAWTPSFNGYDGGGNVRTLANSAGAVTDQYEYDAFGNSFTVSGTTPNNYLYRGEQFDQDLGLYYLRARYYNPLTGRFVNRDPGNGGFADPETLHKYLYANGDPADSVDPTGWAGTAEDVIVLQRVSVAAATVEALKATGAAIACLYLWDASNVRILPILAEGGTRIIVSPCLAIAIPNKQNPPVPVTVPVPLPQSPPQPSQKSPRCKDLNAIVDGISATIGQVGGSCKVGLTPNENYARLALWIAFLNARLDERAECSQYDPNPEGHDQKIKDIWTNIINCEVILHAF